MAEFTPEQMEWLRNTYASTRSGESDAGRLDPTQLKPTGVKYPTGGGGGDSPNYYVFYTGPNGEQVIAEEDPGGNTLSYQMPGANGQRVVFDGNGTYKNSYEPGKGDFFQDIKGNVFEDKKFMTFLAVAGGLSAYSMANAGTGAAVTGAEMSAPGMEGAAYVGMPQVGAASEAELLAGAGIGAGGGVTNATGGAGSVTAGANGGAGLVPGVAGGAAAGAAGSAASGAAGGATSSVLDSLLGGSGFNLRDLLGLLGVAGSAAQGRNDGQEWRDFYQRAAPDLGHYQSALRNVYDDPASYFRGADFQAAQAVTHNKLQRSDAAGGRLAADAGRQNELQKFAVNGLNDYRQNLQQVVNQNQQVATGTGAAGALGNAQGRENSWLQELLKYINSR